MPSDCRNLSPQASWYVSDDICSHVSSYFVITCIKYSEYGSTNIYVYFIYYIIKLNKKYLIFKKANLNGRIIKRNNKSILIVFHMEDTFERENSKYNL